MTFTSACIIGASVSLSSPSNRCVSGVYSHLIIASCTRVNRKPDSRTEYIPRYHWQTRACVRRYSISKIADWSPCQDCSGCMAPQRNSCPTRPTEQSCRQYARSEPWSQMRRRGRLHLEKMLKTQLACLLRRTSLWTSLCVPIRRPTSKHSHLRQKRRAIVLHYPSVRRTRLLLVKAAIRERRDLGHWYCPRRNVSCRLRR